MFGYINVNGAQLSEENKKIYQSYYCGLCRKLKEFCGKKGQALLNYDMTFLVVLLTGLYEPDTQTGEFTCMMHPMKKRQLRENDIQSYAAQMNVLLAYYNLVDDWKDDHNYTKKTIASMFEKDYQRIKINYPRQTNAIEQYMEKLAAYEAEKQTNIDLVAGLTGEMLNQAKMVIDNDRMDAKRQQQQVIWDKDIELMQQKQKHMKESLHVKEVHMNELNEKDKQIVALQEHLNQTLEELQKQSCPH